MPKIVTWTPDEAQMNLAQRLADAKKAKAPFEKLWQVNERIVFNNTNNSTPSMSMTDLMGMSDAPDQGTGRVTINYAFKNLRFIHAQLSSNPPSVVPKPISSDQEDTRKADAADRVIRYGLKQYDLQEKVDQASLSTLLRGTGVAKVFWDPNLGDILDVAEDTGELVTEGDFRITIPSAWDIFIDADAELAEDIRFVFERILVPYEEALYKWPEHEKLLKQYRTQNQEFRTQDTPNETSSLSMPKYDAVELWEYWEKGLPSNGLLGRYAIITRDGTPLTGILPNPERYGTKAGKKIEKAILPYHFLTDIDVPNQVWGKSFIEYVAPIQDTLNRMHMVSLDILQAHGVARLLVPEGTEIAEDSITTSTWDIVKFSGPIPPSYMAPLPFPTSINNFMDIYKMGIDDMSAVNESMFGKQSREQSGFSMQYSVNQGNMIRYRLLNKYRRFVENIYKSYLKIIQKHWDLPKTIAVLGNEKAFEVKDIKGADLDGGYDLIADYGASLSLDPTTRREEMMMLMPLFEKSGVEPRQLMKMLKLNDLSSQYDLLDLASDRMREIFEEMIANNTYIAPEELQDHKNMLSYAYMYIMTAEFKYLPEDGKTLIRKHILEREQLAAAGATPAPAPGAAPAGAPGMPALPPMPGLPV